MATIIGRKHEISELERLYNSKKAEFVVVYGRRRIGKTFLVRNLFEDRISFVHTALSPSEFEAGKLIDYQLRAFCVSLQNQGADMNQAPSDWFEAFSRLQKLVAQKHEITKGRLLVFIDELPWMDNKGSGFVTAFEHFWNSWASAKDYLMLVVCGSATTWINDKLLNNYGGLYGRITAEILLAPFSLKECEQYFESQNVVMSRYDQVQCYMIMGGIPYYLSFINAGQSLAQNIDALFFAKNGRLRLEFDRLMNSLYSTPQSYSAVLKFLSTKREGFTRKEIADATGLSYGGAMTAILKGLEASSFIEPYLHYNGSKRNVHYKLVDSFVLFYMTFVNGKNGVSPTFWSDSQLLPSIQSWRGFSFEGVCQNHIESIKRALGITGVRTNQAPWRSKATDPAVQIDLVIDRADRVINLCEMKFSINDFEVTKKYEAILRNKVATFIEETKCRKSIHPTLVTTYGLKRNAYSSFFQKVITMDDLFE
ncbi:MAG: ATP-binding protein [Muribaculaceae bacterium]|nr:ATP-binding protein [Muribaculaceae bacterium]